MKLSNKLKVSLIIILSSILLLSTDGGYDAFIEAGKTTFVIILFGIIIIGMAIVHNKLSKK